MIQRVTKQDDFAALAKLLCQNKIVSYLCRINQIKNKEMEKVIEKKKTTKPVRKEKVSARDRIKPRGLVGLYKGQIFYDENADIFNLGL